MLTITATNFGVNPALLQINEYHRDDYMVLDGDIPVDTTAAEYAGIRPMKLTVADLPFAKSRVSTALVTASSDGANYCTLAKVWIADKNTICIGKILPYKSLGSYTIHLNTILMPTMVTGPVSLSIKKELRPLIWSLIPRIRRLRSSFQNSLPTLPSIHRSFTTNHCGATWGANAIRLRSGTAS